MKGPSCLTPYPQGSIREIASLCLPMMLTALSGNLMFFCDRIILGHYSLNAMNAAAIATTASVPFIFAAYAISAIAEVFVGQLNGAQKYKDLGKPVWQMIWFSCFSMLFFIPAGLYGGPFILSEPYLKEGLSYYKWIMSTGYIHAFHAALASFFIARGQVKLTMGVTILGNVINLGLDVILIFGIPNFFDPMGAKGAAIATVLSELVPVGILFGIFINASHRKNFHTYYWKLDISLFKECFKIGIPNALAHIVTMSAWYVIVTFMSRLSPEHVTVFQIGQTIFILFTFFADGIQKGVIALASNAIGEQAFQKIPRIFLSSIKLHFLITLTLAIPFLWFPETIIHLFLGDPHHTLATSIILEQGKVVLLYVWMFLFFDDLIWIIAGVLTAGGDTKFIMVMSIIGTWCFGVLPIYFGVFLKQGNPITAWQIVAIQNFITLIFFIRRYFQKKWKVAVVS